MVNMKKFLDMSSFYFMIKTDIIPVAIPSAIPVATVLV